MAIIGSGPSGCYTAQALAKACPDAEITVVDRLPVPYGLIRYGVAGDHQGTKAITRQFARLFERQGVAFMGGIEIGREVSLDDLQGMFDAVVLAVGLHGDRSLGVSRDNLAGLYGSGEVTRYWNGHPDAADFDLRLGRTVAIIGNGNVAMDLARVMAKRAGDFAGTDFDPANVCSDVEDIHVVGRSPIEHARFDATMVKELAGIDGLHVRLAEGDMLGEGPLSEAVGVVLEAKAAPAEKSIVFHSGWSVGSVDGPDTVSAISLFRGEEERRLPCDSIVTAIGFEWDGALNRAALLDGVQDDGRLADGLFGVGWFRRGPRGTIPDNRKDAQHVAKTVAAFLETSGGRGSGREALEQACGGGHTTYEDWLAIDAAEVARAGPARCRHKFHTYSALRAAVTAGKEMV
ncbi:MAG: FAD-dependent oxidoreductase [Pseudomonadota bacterium]